MYAVFLCFVLFNAHGDLTEPYYPAAACLALLLLCIKYVPQILFRQQLTEPLCEDLLHLAAHALPVACAHPPLLRYACALSSTCFLLQHRLRPSVFVHTLAALWLLVAHEYGPRVAELQPFIIAVAAPHAMDVVAQGLVHTHRLMVLWATDT